MNMKRNNKIKLCAIFLFVMCICDVLAQERFGDKINQINSKGEKEGFWIDSTRYGKIEKYYKEGTLFGIYKKYNSKGRLLTFGEYKDGKMNGIWYFFDQNGFLRMLFKNFSKNTYSIINEEDKKTITPDYKCYSVSYYPNGNIKNEGLLLWSEGEAPESEFSDEYGVWKYYYINGELIKTKEFK